MAVDRADKEDEVVVDLCMMDASGVPDEAVPIVSRPAFFSSFYPQVSAPACTLLPRRLAFVHGCLSSKLACYYKERGY
jgi:hypothetical protein